MDLPQEVYTVSGSKDSEPPMICPTLPTCVGMVVGGGMPRNRPCSGGRQREELNEAAMHDPGVTLDELKRYITGRKRLDVEQAVAMVLSVLGEQQAASLLPHIASVLASSCMWRTDEDLAVPEDPVKVSQAACQRKIWRMLWRDCLEQEAPPFNTQLLVNLLMLVRRHRVGLAHCQCLALPPLLLNALPGLPEDQRVLWQQDCWRFAGSSGQDTAAAGQAASSASGPETKSDEIILVSRRNFKRIAQWLYRISGDQRAGAVLNRQIAAAAEGVLYGHLPAGLASRDTLAVAFSFLALQRRLQQRVVSNMGWTRFLQTGEGRQLQQNAPQVLTSLELELARMALAQPHPNYAALTAIVTPPGCGEHAPGSVERLHEGLTGACKLMQRYVVVHAEGHMEQLGPRTRDRGPVDQYNLLCDLVYEIRDRCRALGAADPDIGPCHKFLAKDIMACNRSWADDAFAPGKVPGWVGWLQRTGDLAVPLPAAPAHVADANGKAAAEDGTPQQGGLV